MQSEDFTQTVEINDSVFICGFGGVKLFVGNDIDLVAPIVSEFHALYRFDINAIGISFVQIAAVYGYDMGLANHAVIRSDFNAVTIDFHIAGKSIGVGGFEHF